MATDFDFSKAVSGPLRVEYLTGHQALRVQEVLALTGVHAVVLEMARTLIDEYEKQPPGKLARFNLSNTHMKDHADDIFDEFVKGLSKSTKALAKKNVKIKSGRDGDSLVFWLEEKKGNYILDYLR